jgi:hypothetical protein
MAIGRIPEPGTGIPESIIAAKGDILVGTANDTPAVLSVGTDTYTLVADSATATGLKWAAPAGGGKILQVIQTTVSSAQSSATTAYADITSMSATITPSAATSKVLVMMNLGGVLKNSGNASNNISLKILRASTNIYEHVYINNTDSTVTVVTTVSLSKLDSPATTSATTYKVQFANGNASSFISVMAQNQESTLILMEVGA